MSQRTVCVVTGTRAEYGLLYWLLRGLADDLDLNLQILATGMHLSPEFGLTYQQIEKDGFRIDAKVEMLLSSDTPVGVAKSMGVGMIGFADVYDRLRPDLLLVLGDRFEVFAAVSAAMIARIPVAHMHGGEATEGLIDEPIRHSVTKMSHLHFTSTERYRERVIQLGEQPDRVFNVGALGIENINRLELLSREAFEDSINFRLGKRTLLITFHPVTLETATAASQFTALLTALDELPDTHLIFTKPNADTDGRVIIQLIDEYVARNPQKAVAFISLGQLRYLSALRYVDAAIGNSSSGLLEVPSFRIGTLNIGDRQQGRIKAASVIDCEPTLAGIREGLAQLFAPEFQATLPTVDNPYGTASPSAAIITEIKRADLSTILKKRFYDLPAAVPSVRAGGSSADAGLPSPEAGAPSPLPHSR